MVLNRLLIGLVLTAGCNLKFPGPHINLDLPDASILGSFAGSGANAFPGGAGTGAPAAVQRPAHVIDARAAVSGAAPAAACPSGQPSTAGGACQLRSGVAPQCPLGGNICQNGRCCPAGFSCSNTGACERMPGGASFTTPGVCAFGRLVTTEGSNCSALSAQNATALRARCCPEGASLRCSDPNDARTAVCALAGFPTASTCPSGYTPLADANNPSALGCCPTHTGPVQLVSGECLYTEVESPACGGALDSATGGCCAGALTQDGRCCSAGHQVCGSGCCELGESCDSVTGQCASAQQAAPVCPTQASRDCSSFGGQCCPGDTQCRSDGTCSCPAATPVDCGGFCATSTEQCSCPSDHPDACGAQCCLHGGCGNGAPGSAASCGCPATTMTCGDNCCPSGSQCVSGQCMGCSAEAPTLCGNNCCTSSETCSGGICVAQRAPTQPSVGGPSVALPDAGTTHATTAPDAGTTLPADAGTPHSGGGGSGTSTPPPAGATCAPVPAECSACSVTACAIATSSGGCQSWYQASDGRKYECSGCGDCAGAAQAAVGHCCPVHP